MHLLFGPNPGPVDDDRLLDLYDWPDRPWLRAMMVTALDGSAAGPDGRSRSITGPADQRVFTGVRRFADAVLVGAGTVRTEGYTALRAHDDDRPRRLAAGQAPAPVLAIVSRSLDLAWDEGFAASEVRPLVLTGSGADPDRVASARAHADVALLPSAEPTGAEIRTELTRRGLHRVVCEGGPSLLRLMLAAGLVDEADITLAPTFAGSGPAPGEPFEHPVAMSLVHVLHGDDFLLARYRRSAA